MSACNIVRDLMPLYYDAAISASSRQAVRAHLRTCPQCRAYFSTLRRSAHTATPSIPPMASSDISALLKRAKKHEIRRRAAFAGLFAASLALGVARLIQSRSHRH